MRKNVFLIDQENVHAPILGDLAGMDCEVFVFIGENTNKLPREVAIAMQALGDRAKYVEIVGSGRNALDFHIAYQLGEFSTRKDDCYFHVISKDTGFDPLIKYLRSRAFLISRSESVARSPIMRVATAKSPDDRLTLIEDRLAAYPKNRPQRERTLVSMISSHFLKKLGESEISDLVAELQSRGTIIVKDGKVTYPPST